jgi:lipopolysaccharide transport system ATP-binding protein
MKPIIELKGISKRFLIQHKTGGYLNLRDAIGNIFKPSSWSNESFWALDNINFNIMPGESLAIIGRNGAGKSTLLKILSRITPPTHGSIISRGRISSLLEVGTGFHPELSGRENIFFNGSLLGMRKAEIEKKFEEIVEFSGTEKFLDTPLKHFSSGMQLRLAFSVAAFLESEILILDEVLAVGDAEFQKKCIGKIDDVTKSGRTILFVSHNMTVVRSLCTRAVVLSKGKIDFMGTTDSSIDHYLNTTDTNTESPGEKNLVKHPNKKDPDRGMTYLRLLRNDKPTNLFFTGEKFTAEIEYRDIKPVDQLMFGLVIKDSNQQPVIGINNSDLGITLLEKPASEGKIIFEIEKLPLYGNATYFINLYLGEPGNDFDIIEDAITFHLESQDIYGAGKVLNPKVNMVFAGKVKIRHSLKH